VVKHDAEGVAVVFAGLIAAITWNYLTWCIGMPSSSSHAIIGGLVGAGLAAGGLSAINWSVVQTALIAIVASPMLAFAVAFLAMLGLARLQRRLTIPDDAKAFKGLQLLSAAAVSFGHGANDAQKTMGSSPRSCWPAGTSPCSPMGICTLTGGSPSSPTAPSRSAPSGEAGRSSRRWVLASPRCAPAPGWRPTSAQ
jgi:hypothetical protein